MSSFNKFVEGGSGITVPRRTFLQGASAMGLALATGITPTFASTAKKGGILRIAVAHGSTADTLNPWILNNGMLQNIALAFGNCLTEISASGQLSPELAASFESSPDAKTWTFKIRDGVQFHNGKSLEASDVVATINYHRGEDSTSEAKVLVDSIDNISALDSTTVQFTLSAGNADFPFLMADHHLIIFPSEDDVIDWKSNVGTGPYMITEFNPGVRASAKRNPNYWKEGRAHFDEVKWVSVVDGTARQNALISGEVDAIDQVPLNSIKLFARQKGVSVLNIAGMLHYTFPMLTDTAPFDNNNVRMAIKHAVNRQELLDKILYGYGTLGNDHPISTANRFHASDIPQREQDLDKAKWHAKEAAIGSTEIPLHIADSVFTGAVDAAVLISERAAEAGLNIKVVREPNDGYWSNVWQNKPWCASYWGGRPTEDWMLSSAYLSTASANESRLNNPKLDSLIFDARAELDDAKRREMYHDAQLLIRDAGGSLIPMYANHVHGLSDKLAHEDTVGGNWQFDGHRAAERWWFS